MTNKIRVGLIGVGNCAKSIVEGTQYYNENPDDRVGLMYPDIGGYTVHDLQFVVGFDVDPRKVNKPLKEALRANPNCAMDHVRELLDTGEHAAIETGAMVHCVPTHDGVAPWMLEFPEDVSFRVTDQPGLTREAVIEKLQELKVDVLVNYLPVGSEDGTRWWLDIALESGIHFVNCIPAVIGTDEVREYEQKFIDAGLTIVGSDMRSAWGASRMSEVLQGALIDSGLYVTQHIQMNMAAGSTQGQEHIRTGRTANTDFLNMAEKSRLHNKHVSKERVLTGQSIVRDESVAGTTLYAGPSLTVFQKPGGQYVGSDNKIANFDIVAYGFAGARYEMTARLSVQDSANSAGVVISAIRFNRVASEMGIVGYLRGPSAWTQKSPPLQMKTDDAKFECDALARRELTRLTRAQLKENLPKAVDLSHSFGTTKTDYEQA